MKDVYKSMVERLTMTGMEPERRFILDSAYLKKLKAIFVFDGLEEGTDL